MAKFNSIMIVGAGFMGSGIAQVAASSGYKVVLNDMQDSFLNKAMSGIEKNLDRQIEKKELDAGGKKQILERITCTTDLQAAKTCDLVIEAVPESKEIKATLFKAIDEICGPGTVFASNTSSLPITELAALTKRPKLFVGMHFFSPVPKMKLVEIIKGLKTSQETANRIKDLVTDIGKIGVFVKDGPGFLVNRISCAMRCEVYQCLAEGVASIEDIDNAIKYGLGHPMGPFELSDFTGLDIGLAVAETMFDTLKDSKWAPSLLLRKLVTSGDLGRKAGKGWYDYTSGEKKVRDDLNL
jgi:3-hydroxybutyryl-CoA dehydrogenase